MTFASGIAVTSHRMVPAAPWDKFSPLEVPKLMISGGPKIELWEFFVVKNGSGISVSETNGIRHDYRHDLRHDLRHDF